jgi:anti-sigma factor RsiW
MRPRWTRPTACRRTLRRLQAFLDGESDPEQAGRVARHLSRCEDCFRDAAELRAVKDALMRLRVAPGGDTLVRLRRLVAELSDPSSG